MMPVLMELVVVVAETMASTVSAASSWAHSLSVQCHRRCVQHYVYNTMATHTQDCCQYMSPADQHK